MGRVFRASFTRASHPQNGSGRRLFANGRTDARTISNGSQATWRSILTRARRKLPNSCSSLRAKPLLPPPEIVARRKEDTSAIT